MNKYKLLLILGWWIIFAGIIVLLCEVIYRTDVLSRKIDSVNERINETEIPKMPECQCNCKKEEADTDAATSTGAECTPEEPTTTEVYSETLSEPQEDTEEIEVALEAIGTTESQEKASEESAGELEYAGIFEITAYTWTGNPCANGNYPTARYTVASNYFPLGTKIYIEGVGEFVVEDTGGMASNVIDIYMDSQDECVQFGRRQAGVYKIQ